MYSLVTRAYLDLYCTCTYDLSMLLKTDFKLRGSVHVNIMIYRGSLVKVMSSTLSTQTYEPMIVTRTKTACTDK